MKHAGRKRMEASPRVESASAYSPDVLDDNAVLERLQTDLGTADDRNRLLGIRNGIVIGGVLWVLLLTAVVIVL